jgi:hypothetical protein
MFAPANRCIFTPALTQILASEKNEDFSERLKPISRGGLFTRFQIPRATTTAGHRGAQGLHRMDTTNPPILRVFYGLRTGESWFAFSLPPPVWITKRSPAGRGGRTVRFRAVGAQRATGWDRAASRSDLNRNAYWKLSVVSGLRNQCKSSPGRELGLPPFRLIYAGTTTGAGGFRSIGFFALACLNRNQSSFRDIDANWLSLADLMLFDLDNVGVRRYIAG